MLKVTVLGVRGTKVRLGFEVVPGDRYRPRNGLHTLFLGHTYRDLWTTPIRVPVLGRLQPMTERVVLATLKAEAPKPVSTHSEVWSYEIAGGSQPG